MTRRPPGSVCRRIARLVAAQPAGVRAADLAAILGVAHATASAALGRMFWAGTVDRTLDGRSYRYTPREKRI